MPARLDIPKHQSFQLGLINRHPPRSKHLYFFCIAVHAKNAMSALSQTRSRNQPDVSGPDDRSVHAMLSLSFILRECSISHQMASPHARSPQKLRNKRHIESAFIATEVVFQNALNQEIMVVS